MLTQRFSNTPQFHIFQRPVYMYICIIIVAYVAMYIDDSIHYIGTKSLSSLSNKDGNKIPTKSKQNCCHALQYGSFHLERNFSIPFSKNLDFLTLFNTKLDGKMTNLLHQFNTIVTMCIYKT